MSTPKERILLITNIFPPDIGGPATFIPCIGSALAKKGYRVTVICTSDHRNHPDDSRFPFRLIRLKRGRNWMAHEILTRATLLFEIARTSQVFVNGLEHYVDWASTLCRRHFILKIVGDTVWESARNMGLTSLDIDAYQRISKRVDTMGVISRRRYRYIRRASHIITPSEYLRTIVIGWGIPPERVVTVYNGVSGEEFSEIQAFRGRGDVLNIAFIGRLTNWKGVDALLLAAAGVEGVKVTIIGDGPECPALADLALRLNISKKVVFLGRLSRAKLAEELRKTHVVVLPSLYEGLSHTLLEAGAQGIPCIASDRGGNKEVIEDGVGGFLIDPFDVETLKRHIIALRDNDGLRKGMGRALQQRVRGRFPFQKTVDLTIEVIAL